MKKKFLSITLLLLLMFSTEVPAFAATEIVSTASDSGISTRVDVQEWYYRVLNGQIEKRLWSITRGIWLTDWMPV